MNIGMLMDCYHQTHQHILHYSYKDHYNIHLCDEVVTTLSSYTISPSNIVQVSPVNPGGQAHVKFNEVE